MANEHFSYSLPAAILSPLAEVVINGSILDFFSGDQRLDGQKSPLATGTKLVNDGAHHVGKTGPAGETALGDTKVRDDEAEDGTFVQDTYHGYGLRESVRIPTRSIAAI